jgi:amino acid transporter
VKARQKSASAPAQASPGQLHRALGVRDVVLINIAAILGLRWLSTAAQMGPSSAVLWLLAVLVFFIPCSLAVMELSSRLPGEGGLYLWSKSAFGEFHGFIAGWAYWVNNVFYFPSLLMFLAGAFLVRISLPWPGSLGGLLLVISSTVGLGAWVTGVARIPYVIGIDRYLPSALGRTHPRYGTPHVALITQGVVVSLIILAASAGSTLREAYILLLDLSIILYFIPFLYMFAALPILRRRAGGDEEGVRLVPLGNAGPWLFGGLGFAATMLSVVLAFIPPAGTSNPGLLVVKTTASTLLFVAVGLGYY